MRDPGRRSRRVRRIARDEHLRNRRVVARIRTVRVSHAAARELPDDALEFRNVRHLENRAEQLLDVIARQQGPVGRQAEAAEFGDACARIDNVLDPGEPSRIVAAIRNVGIVEHDRRNSFVLELIGNRKDSRPRLLDLLAGPAAEVAVEQKETRRHDVLVAVELQRRCYRVAELGRRVNRDARPGQVRQLIAVEVEDGRIAGAGVPVALVILIGNVVGPDNVALRMVSFVRFTDDDEEREVGQLVFDRPVVDPLGRCVRPVGVRIRPKIRGRGDALTLPIASNRLYTEQEVIPARVEHDPGCRVVSERTAAALIFA